MVINESILTFGETVRNTRLKKEQCEDSERFSQKVKIFLDTGCCCMRFINLSLACEIEHGFKSAGKK